jgi:hypothetical protein
VSKIVPAYVGESRTLEQGLEVPVDDVLGLQGSALARGEHEPVMLPFCARPKLAPLSAACAGF